MDQINFQPVSESPAKVPGVDDILVPPAASPEEMRANLEDIKAKLDSKFQDFNSSKFSTDNQMKDQQSQVLGMLFDLLEKEGIDPGNPEEIRNFIENIKLQSPELGDQLEQALQVLLGDEVTPSDQVPVEENNMNINNTPNDTPPQNL